MTQSNLLSRPCFQALNMRNRPSLKAHVYTSPVCINCRGEKLPVLMSDCAASSTNDEPAMNQNLFVRRKMESRNNPHCRMKSVATAVTRVLPSCSLSILRLYLYSFRSIARSTVVFAAVLTPDQGAGLHGREYRSERLPFRILSRSFGEEFSPKLRAERKAWVRG